MRFCPRGAFVPRSLFTVPLPGGGSKPAQTILDRAQTPAAPLQHESPTKRLPAHKTVKTSIIKWLNLKRLSAGQSLLTGEHRPASSPPRRRPFAFSLPALSRFSALYLLCQDPSSSLPRGRQPQPLTANQSHKSPRRRPNGHWDGKSLPWYWFRGSVAAGMGVQFSFSVLERKEKISADWKLLINWFQV